MPAPPKRRVLMSGVIGTDIFQSTSKNFGNVDIRVSIDCMYICELEPVDFIACRRPFTNVSRASWNFESNAYFVLGFAKLMASLVNEFATNQIANFVDDAFLFKNSNGFVLPLLFFDLFDGVCKMATASEMVCKPDRSFPTTP